MTVRFRLPASALERVSFAYSPLLEAVLSLHVLVEPKHHPVQHPWVREARGLPPDLRRRVGAFSFCYRSYFPEFLFPGPEGRLASFEEELDALSDLPGEAVAFEFTRPLYGGAVPRDPGALDDPGVRREILDRARREGSGGEELARLALEEPGELVTEFRRLLSDYWEAAFGAEWQRVEPGLAQATEEAGRQIASEGLYGFLAGLRPEVRADPEAEAFWLERPHHHEVTVGEGDGLVLVPSFYVWPHVRVNCDEPWPLGLVYPAPMVAREAGPRVPPEDLSRVLKALSDDTRLGALRLIAERPRSTQELAPLVRVSEAALSKHLRLMAEAGVLRARREGYYVLYELEPARLRGLSSGLSDFLGLR